MAMACATSMRWLRATFSRTDTATEQLILRTRVCMKSAFLRGQPQALKQLPVFVGLGVWGGQQLVAVENGIGAGKEAQCLQAVVHGFTACRQPNHGLGHGNTGDCDRTYKFKG